VSGWYFWRPEAKYFGVGKVADDQQRDYMARCERTRAPIVAMGNFGD
jgi:hypothetical protein